MSLVVTGLAFAHPSSEAAVKVASWSIAAGERIALTGPSGAGKTTLLRLIAGILTPQSGTIVWHNDDLTRLSDAARRAHRLQHLGVVFQDFALLDYLTVAENTLLPLSLSAGVTDHHQTRARELTERLGIARYWSTPTARLSQGEQQRVALVRALVHEPQLILADEPTASLDTERKVIATELMLSDAKARGATLICITHDAELLPMFDRVVSWKEVSA